MDISQKLEMMHLGLRFKLCLVISFLLLFHLYTFRLPDSFEHLMCATLFLFTTSFGVCTKTEIVALSELKNPPLCKKFHCFRSGQTLAPFFFHSML